MYFQYFSLQNIASGIPSPSLTVQSVVVQPTVPPSVAVTTSIAAVVTPSPTPSWVDGMPDPPSTQVNAQPGNESMFNVSS